MKDILYSILIFIIILFLLISFYRYCDEKNIEMLENYEIIETYINPAKNGRNQYYIILKNPSGDFIEINTDVNTYFKYAVER